MISYEIEDFSTYGTFLNGSRLPKNTKTSIKNDDEIAIVINPNALAGGKVEVRLSYIFQDAE